MACHVNITVIKGLKETTTTKKTTTVVYGLHRAKKIDLMKMFLYYVRLDAEDHEAGLAFVTDCYTNDERKKVTKKPL